MNIPNIIIGAIILCLGRKLFWLFIACMGFISGLNYAEFFVGPQPSYIIWSIAVLGGFVGALLAVLLQELAVGFAGFVAGGYFMIQILHIFNLDVSHFLWAVCLLGGIIGTALMVFIFDWGLIVVSSFMGSALIIESFSQMLALESQETIWAMIFLAGFGCIIQARIIGLKPGSQQRKLR